MPFRLRFSTIWMHAALLTLIVSISGCSNTAYDAADIETGFSNSLLDAELSTVEPCTLLSDIELTSLSLSAGRPQNPEPAGVEDCLFDVDVDGGGRASIGFYFDDAKTKLLAAVAEVQSPLDMIQIGPTVARQAYQDATRSGSGGSRCVLWVDAGDRQLIVYQISLFEDFAAESDLCGELRRFAAITVSKIP